MVDGIVTDPCDRAANGLPILPLDLKCHCCKTNCLQSQVRTEDFYRRLMSEFRHFVESSFGSFANFFFFFTNFFIVSSRLYRQDALRVEAAISSELRMTGLGFFMGGSVLSNRFDCVNYLGHAFQCSYVFCAYCFLRNRETAPFSKLAS
jgi:hypothetical protein